MKRTIKWATMVSLPMILAACAGGEVKQPEVFVDLQTATAVSENKVNLQDNNKATVSTNGGAVLSAGSTMVYQTPDGKYYELGQSNTIMTPSYSSPNKIFSNKQYMQNTDNGGKLFACCTNASRDYPAVYVNESYYGAWIAPNGTISMFSGGNLADTAYLQGGANSSGKGKATYDVLGVRVKNGQLVNSSYAAKNLFNTDQPTNISRLTVNFNTGKLGGTIIGNSDFGDDIVMKDVSVNGNRFSGSAVSGSAAGTVDGAFYGTHNPNESNANWKHSGDEIGGIVNFGNSALDAAFGGSRTAIDTTNTSTDLTPLVNGENK